MTWSYRYLVQPDRDAWREPAARAYEEQARLFRALGCFEKAQELTEQGHAVRHAYARAERRDLPLCERLVISCSDEREWDLLKAEGVKLDHARPFGPTRDGSKRCESGSIASGGRNEYCACDRCF